MTPCRIASTDDCIFEPSSSGRQRIGKHCNTCFGQCFRSSISAKRIDACVTYVGSKAYVNIVKIMKTCLSQVFITAQRLWRNETSEMFRDSSLQYSAHSCDSNGRVFQSFIVFPAYNSSQCERVTIHQWSLPSMLYHC